MTPLAKLAVISEMKGEASLVKNILVFLHLLYIIIEKQPYLVSTSSYQLSVKPFIPCMRLDLIVFKIM